MWSLIPWRRLLTLATPYIKEVFFGKFNLIDYFLNNKDITVLFITLVCNYLAFQYVSYGYEALNTHNQTLDKQNKAFLVKIGKLQSQVETLSSVASDTPRSSKVSEAGVPKEVVMENDQYKEALYEIVRLKQEERQRGASTQVTK